jgi:hypothetical protein
MSKPIDLQQARELKAAGLPPNLKVITKHWSHKTSELMFAAHKAQDGFLRKMLAYYNTDDRRKYGAMVRAYNKFHDAVTALCEWSEKHAARSQLRVID